MLRFCSGSCLCFLSQFFPSFSLFLFFLAPSRFFFFFPLPLLLFFFFFFLMIRRPPRSPLPDTLFPSPTLFRSTRARGSVLTLAAVRARDRNGDYPVITMEIRWPK